MKCFCTNDKIFTILPIIYEGLVVDFIYVVIESRIHSLSGMYIVYVPRLWSITIYTLNSVVYKEYVVLYMITTGRQSRNSFWRRISYLRVFYFYFQSPLVVQHTWRDTRWLCRPVNSFYVFYLGQSEYASGRIKLIQFQRILWIRPIAMNYE